MKSEKQGSLPKLHIDTSNYPLQPYPYQLEAIEYGLQHKKWLLLDQAGLGKTSVIIHIAEELYKQGKIKHCLIICGINNLKFNWKLEIKKPKTLGKQAKLQSISVSLMTVPFWSISSRFTRSQLCMCCAK